MLLNPRQLPWPFDHGRTWPHGVQVIIVVYVQITGLAGAMLTGRWLSAAVMFVLAHVCYLKAERQLVDALRRQARDLDTCRTVHEWCVLLGIGLAIVTILVMIAWLADSASTRRWGP